MKKGAFNHDSIAQFRARELRENMSISEKVLWSYLRKQQIGGFAFRTQVRVDRYFLDFYCSKAKLCIELDGEQHAFRAPHDARRDEILRNLGIETLRIPSLDLFDPEGMKLHRWLKVIEELCRERSENFKLQFISTPQPPSSFTNQNEEGGTENI